MKIELWVTGKTAFPYLEEGTALYIKRLERYIPFQMTIFADVKNAKNMSADILKQKECEQLLAKFTKDDVVFLFDEHGKQHTSLEFATFIDKQMSQSVKRLIFVIGGAYGFSEEFYKRANGQLSLSKMTFSHQMIRLFAVEQVYRAMTILKGEPYHNEG
jgi:23S rRNA (pseudouridine1915-N3)-methyltransferase